MRIIGGLRRGLVLRGRVPQGVRPTSDRGREALFMLLTEGSWSGGVGRDKRFADVCAGVGSVGLEALSRGVEEVVFVEESPCEGLYENIRLVGLPGCRVVRGDVLKLGGDERGFDVVFMDPPYGCDFYGSAILRLRDRGWLREGGRLVLEVDRVKAASCEEIVRGSGLEDVESRKYGRNVFVSGVLKG